MDTLLYILAGASVGLAVGITGVGGGSLMTPLLLLFGFPAHIAIGTDLAYACVTKAGGVIVHKRNNTVRFRIVALLAAGSIPASMITIYILKNHFNSPEYYTRILTNSLGIMLITTGLVVMMKNKLQNHAEKEPNRFQLWTIRNASVLTFFMGLILGAFVTLSSVGAGAFGAAALLLLYPLLPSVHVIGTDLAHAVPLTFIAALGHIYLGHVDFELLGSLLIGSLPAIYIGTKLGAKMPEKVIRPLLASVLLIIGVKYAFF